MEVEGGVAHANEVKCSFSHFAFLVPSFPIPYFSSSSCSTLNNRCGGEEKVGWRGTIVGSFDKKFLSQKFF